MYHIKEIIYLQHGFSEVHTTENPSHESTSRPESSIPYELPTIYHLPLDVKPNMSHYFLHKLVSLLIFPV